MNTILHNDSQVKLAINVTGEPTPFDNSVQVKGI